MKLPKIFTLDKLKEYKENNKVSVETLEELVGDENLHNEIGKFDLGGEIKVCDVYKQVLITGIKQMTNTGALKLVNRGINYEAVEKAFSVTYRLKEAIFVQYTDETSLVNNLQEIFRKGLKCDNEIQKFPEKFLFKKNISIYLEGDKDFIKTLREYYRKKGFKQIACELKAV